MKDVKWHTHNCSVGFLVAGKKIKKKKSVVVITAVFFKGIWNNRFYPMTSIISSTNRSAAHDLLVSGDTDGYLRLFRYEACNVDFVQQGLFMFQIPVRESESGIQ